MAAQISFTSRRSPPCPYTLQTFAVLLVGASFGGSVGALAHGSVPARRVWQVFPGSPTGSSGYRAAKVTMGYLLGFIVAAAVVGYLSSEATTDASSSTGGDVPRQR